ncbi:MAG: sensor histidine kinase [Nitrososphaera sp.]|uniref:sensor histidine kinase n=1 Tax=Nitrososphaera sp. TaxID=1971748 RepID=UPI003D6DF520
MEIRTRLFLSILAVGILLGISGYLFYDQILKVGRSFDEVQNRATPLIIALGDIKSDFNQLVASILAFTIHGSPEHEQEVEAAKEELLASYDDYAAIEQDGAASEKLGDEIFALMVLGDGMVEIGQGSAHDHGEDPAMADEADHAAAGPADGSAAEPDVEELHLALQEFDAQAMSVRAELDSRIEANVASMQVKQAAVLTDIANGTNLTVLITIAALGVVVGVGGFVAYSLTKRVTQLARTANSIAQGRLEQQITTTGSDEIAALASNFEHMRKSLVQAQGDLKDKNLKLEDLNVILEKANAELKKLDKMKDEFISVASHELRSPIHPILGYASMARDGMIPSKEALDVIYGQATRLKQLANDILDVSRIESGTFPYSMKRTGIHEVLSSCIEATKPSVDAGRVSLVADLSEENEEVEAEADRERLTQVFMNILGNALKFTKKGRITVGTRLAASGMLEITFSDTGAGIPEEVLPKLFNKFVTKKVGEDVAHGTGLGLFICKAIVEAHGGRISAFNNSAGGATFRIELPVSKAEKAAEKPIASREKPRHGAP